MNKLALLLILTVAAILTGVLFWRNGMRESGFQQSVMAAAQSLETQTSRDVAIDLSNYAFKEPIVKVHKGTTITWTNRDNAPHTVTSDMGGTLDSPVLNRGGTFQQKMEALGTFTYHCTPHPQMHGAIIVVE